MIVTFQQVVQVRGGQQCQAAGQARPAGETSQWNTHHQRSQSRRFWKIPVQRQQLRGGRERRDRPYRHW